jgi:hypothetical protein
MTKVPGTYRNRKKEPGPLLVELEEIFDADGKRVGGVSVLKYAELQQLPFGDFTPPSGFGDRVYVAVPLPAGQRYPNGNLGIFKTREEAVDALFDNALREWSLERRWANGGDLRPLTPDNREPEGGENQ